MGAPSLRVQPLPQAGSPSPYRRAHAGLGSPRRVPPQAQTLGCSFVRQALQLPPGGPRELRLTVCANNFWDICTFITAESHPWAPSASQTVFRLNPRSDHQRPHRVHRRKGDPTTRPGAVQRHSTLRADPGQREDMQNRNWVSSRGRIYALSP